MRGYDSGTYGRAFADVYDDWYGSITDIDQTVRFLTALLPDGSEVSDRARTSIIELGVGTGRLAVPLAVAGRERAPEVVVCGLDSSAEMLAVLRERDPEGLVRAIRGDMVADLRTRPVLDVVGDAGADVVFVAYNTLFNIRSEQGQRACFAAVAALLRPGGRFVVEAFVPDPGAFDDHIGIRTMTTDCVVLSASRQHDDQRSEGHFIELTEAGGVRLRPWAIRWSTVAQLDAMADAAGLVLERRLADFDGSVFDDGAERHVSVYRRSDD